MQAKLFVIWYNHTKIDATIVMGLQLAVEKVTRVPHNESAVLLALNNALEGVLP